MDGIVGKRVEELFDEAMDKPPSERPAFLDTVCAADSELRAQVEKLLRTAERAGDFLDSPTVSTLTAPVSPDECEGAQIGPYKLLQRIGEGGFAVVYMAEQTEPVLRKVALKIIKPGMETKQVIGRFEAERQALAMMDHPNIAHVFDAGTTDSGRPYFVMELVRGVPISEYCDKNRLSPRQRLELLAQVCHAVQHAHQKGIIHRDIKPSNVLVTSHNGAGVPKVIDFGIAKAMHTHLTDKTVFTGFRQLIGTPAYMSPEQAELSGLDIDTRSDVYSLGVLLYELLTGQTPFDSHALREAPFDELRRIIREDSPPTPSTRVSSLISEPEAPARDSSAIASHTLDGASSSVVDIARHRRTDLQSLSRYLRGDLDCIVMKCLEKDRTRRYQSASAFAEDMQRYLTNQPILARPPSAIYQTRKWVARHKVPFAFIAALFVLTAGSSIWMTVLYGRAGTERDRALDAEQLSEERLAETQQARDESESVTEFLADMLGAVDPAEEGKEVTVLQVLDQVAETIGEKFEDKPLIEARLRSTIGVTYQALGEYDAAEPHLERALEIRRRLLGDDHPDTLESINRMGDLLLCHGKLAEAGPYFREALGKRLLVLGDDHPDTLTSMDEMAQLLWAQQEYSEAEPYSREALEKRRRVLGDDHPDTLESITGVGTLLWSLGKLSEAEPYWREALEGRRRVLGDEHPSTLISINNMGLLLRSQGRLAEAEPYMREALKGLRRVLGDEHPSTVGRIVNLGHLLFEQRKYSEAEPYFREALEGRVLGDEHRSTLEEMLPEHWRTGLFLMRHGVCLSALERYDEAEAALLEAHEIIAGHLGAEHERTTKVVKEITDLYEFWDATEPGQGYADKAAEWRAKLSDTDPDSRSP